MAIPGRETRHGSYDTDYVNGKWVKTWFERGTRNRYKILDPERSKRKLEDVYKLGEETRKEEEEEAVGNPAETAKSEAKEECFDDSGENDDLGGLNFDDDYMAHNEDRGEEVYDFKKLTQLEFYEGMI